MTLIENLAKLVKELNENREKNNKDRFNKQTKVSYHKSCYEICELLKWNTSLIKKIEPHIGITANAVRTYARKYALENLKIKEKDLNKQIETYAQIYKKNKKLTYNVDKYYKILNSLINVTVEEEIIKIIKEVEEQEKLHIGCLKKRIPTFVFENYPQQKNILIQNLNEKIEVYQLYKKEENKKNKKTNNSARTKTQPTKEEILQTSINYIKLFLQSDINNIDTFCKVENVTRTELESLLSCCKRENYELYLTFLDELVKRNNPLRVDSEELIKQIVYLLQNGIEEKDGTVREFDQIDFYLMSNLDYKDFCKLLEINLLENMLTLEEIKQIKTFFLKDTYPFQANLMMVKKIINGQLLAPIQTNTKENYYYDPNKEEIKLIMRFLVDNNIPLNKHNYITAMTRYLNNQLPLGYNTPKQRRLNNN